MLISANRLKTQDIRAHDGQAGKVTTLLINDESWVVRFLVVRRGVWPFRRSTLLSTAAVYTLVRPDEPVRTHLTREEIRNATPAQSARPISDRKDDALSDYRRTPIYWGGKGLWSGATKPGEAGAVAYRPGTDSEQEPEVTARDAELSHLRSSRELEGYSVVTGGDTIGKVTDLLVEQPSWAVRYLTVEMSGSSRKTPAFVSPEWVSEVSWQAATISLDADLESLADSPHLGADGTLTRDEEERLHQYMDRPSYWS